MAPGRSTLPPGTKTSRSAEFGVTGTGNNFFPSGSLGVILSGIIPLSTSWSLDPWILAMGETVPYIRCWFKAYTAFCRTLPQPSRLLPPNWHCNCAFKRLFHLSGRLFEDGGEHAKTSGFLVVGPLLQLHVSGCEVSSLVKQYCVDYHVCGSGIF